MTPQEAQELLAKVKGSDPSALAELMDWKEVAEALETIANLCHEYAVQLQMSDGAWHFTDDEYYPFGTLEPRHVEWQTKTGAEEFHASFVEDCGPKHFRIVRRLTSEPEVVE